MITYLTQPLSQEVLLNTLLCGDSIEEVVKVSLFDLVGNDFDSLNNLLQTIIIGENEILEVAEGDNPIVRLSDVSYQIIDHERNENGGYIFLLVNAQLNAY